VALLAGKYIKAHAANFNNLEFPLWIDTGSEVLHLISPGQVLSGNTPSAYNTSMTSTGANWLAAMAISMNFTFLQIVQFGFGGYGRGGTGSYRVVVSNSLR